MSRLRLLLGILVFLTIPAGSIRCGRTLEPPQPVHLRSVGATSMTSLISELSKAYSQRYPHITIEISGGGSRLGIEAVQDGRVDFGLVSRELTEEEITDPQTGARKLWPATVAIDGIAIIVHPSNPVNNLTLEELRGVFSGKIWDWADLGGNPGEIQVVSREDGSGTRDTFEIYAMGGHRVTLTALVMPATDAILDYVASDPQSIAYVSAGNLREDVKPIRVEGVEPTTERIMDSTYPLNRPFLMVTQAEPQGEVRAFLDFVLSPSGQAIVAKRYVRIR